MALVVNKDSYITMQEATEYYTKYYTSADPLLVQWNAMTESDREVYLRKAFLQINSLPFTGRPENVKQTLPFPRHCFNSDDLLKVKYAQAEQALALTDTVAQQETEDRLRLRRAGVTQYRIGDLSETFQKGLPENSNNTFFGLSEKAYNYLSKWLKGGYKICTSIRPHYGIRWWYPL